MTDKEKEIVDMKYIQLSYTVSFY